MKIGIVAGGFKPFTSGHFSKVALSDKECDKTLLLYSSAERSRGGGVELQSEQLELMWKLLTPRMKDVFGERIVIKDASPWPISAVYGIIKCATRSINHPVPSERERALGFLRNFGITETVSHVTVYGSSEDLDKRFISHIRKNNSHKMFDDFYDQGKLDFSDGKENLVSIAKNFYPGLTDDEIEDRVKIRGTSLRVSLKHGKREESYRYFPPILSGEESQKLFNILCP